MMRSVDKSFNYVKIIYPSSFPLDFCVFAQQYLSLYSARWLTYIQSTTSFFVWLYVRHYSLHISIRQGLPFPGSRMMMVKSRPDLNFVKSSSCVAFPWITLSCLSNMNRSLYSARWLTFNVVLLPKTAPQAAVQLWFVISIWLKNDDGMRQEKITWRLQRNTWFLQSHHHYITTPHALSLFRCWSWMYSTRSR